MIGLESPSKIERDTHVPFDPVWSKSMYHPVSFHKSTNVSLLALVRAVKPPVYPWEVSPI
jgi:hypothetical protein